MERQFDNNCTHLDSFHLTLGALRGMQLECNLALYCPCLFVPFALHGIVEVVLERDEV